MSTQSPAIRCRQLHFHRGLQHVLQGIDISIPQGAVVALIGANGSGKSTLLRCMAGLLLPSHGKVEIFSRPALAMDDATRERLGYVPQAPELFPWLTVEQHLRSIGQAYAKWTERRALEMAVSLNLPLGKLVSKLSGGDQQKLAVVLASAHRPDLILMDEPVASLDPMVRAQFMRTLFSDAMLGGAEQKPTIVICSHILSDLEPIITHVALMRAGSLHLFEEWAVMQKRNPGMSLDQHFIASAAA